MPGFDSNTELLLHFDGADESTTIVDTAGNHSPTVAGTAKIDSAQSKWGGTSLFLDGNSDYITIPTSTAFDLFNNLNNLRTVDFWARSTDNSLQQYMLSRREASSDHYGMRINWTGSDSIQAFRREAASTDININETGGAPTTATWQHWAFIIIGNGSKFDVGIYLNGAQVGYGTATATQVLSSAPFIIGQSNESISGGSDGDFFNGWIDEFRIQNSNYFGAAPVVGKTDTITVPTGPYASAKNQSIILV